MSNQKTQYNALAAVFLLLLLALTTSACRTGEKGRKASSDWSRSAPVGFFVRGDIDIVSDEAGQQTHLVWLQQDSEQPHIHYLQLDEEAVVQVDRRLDMTGDQLRRPLVEFASGANLHVLWSSREENQRSWDLFVAQFDQSGELLREPQALLTADQDADYYDAAPDGLAGLYIVWESGADGAIYGSQISSSGEVLQGPVRLVAQGENPSLAAEGTQLHLTWWHAGEIRYAFLADGKLVEVDSVPAGRRNLNDGQILDGPVLGLTADRVYILWSVFSTSGLRAGTAVTEYVAFLKEAPGPSPVQQIFISTAEEPSYATFNSAYQLTQLAPPVEAGAASDFVHQPHPARGRGGELAVAVTLDQERRLDLLKQTGILLFKGGEFMGYQVAGKTETYSQAPALAGDENGNLYMAWREGGQGSVAQYALTTPQGRSRLDRVSGGDIANVVLGTGIEMIVGVLFFPLAGLWILPGLIIFGLWHLWRGDDDQFRTETVIMLVLAITVSEAIKFAFLPLVSAFVPFAAWFDIAPQWEDPLRYLVPIITMGIGFLVALLMRRRNPSPLAFFFWFIAVDAVLTLGIYGVSFLGA